MGQVAVQMKIMPGDVAVDLKRLSDHIASVSPRDARLHSCKVQPVAFGLKALLITFIVEDKEGGTEALEETIANMEEVESVQVVAVTRML
jgi:elongation factor 1-beta